VKGKPIKKLKKAGKRTAKAIVWLSKKPWARGLAIALARRYGVSI
jgi:hypothetical protein